MREMKTEEFLERIFHQDYQALKGRTLRMTRLRVPGKAVCLAHVMSPTQAAVYENLGLHIGVHEGENHEGEAVGLLRFTPWESAVVAADVALKGANVEIGFMDRFNGTLIVTGERAEVEGAVEKTVAFFRDELGFVCL